MKLKIWSGQNEAFTGGRRGKRFELKLKILKSRRFENLYKLEEKEKTNQIHTFVQIILQNKYGY